MRRLFPRVSHEYASHRLERAQVRRGSHRIATAVMFTRVAGYVPARNRDV